VAENVFFLPLPFRFAAQSTRAMSAKK